MRIMVAEVAAWMIIKSDPTPTVTKSSKTCFEKKLPYKKKLADSGLVTIISVNLKSKSSLRKKKSYGEFEIFLNPPKLASNQN